MFWGQIEKEDVKSWNYSLQRWEEDSASSEDAVPKKPTGLFKCWT